LGFGLVAHALHFSAIGGRARHRFAVTPAGYGCWEHHRAGFSPANTEWHVDFDSPPSTIEPASELCCPALEMELRAGHAIRRLDKKGALRARAYGPSPGADRGQTEVFTDARTRKEDLAKRC
jgi:hypothetical protein